MSSVLWQLFLTLISLAGIFLILQVALFCALLSQAIVRKRFGMPPQETKPLAAELLIGPARTLYDRLLDPTNFN